jgi:3-phenylpropionate/trans-cinnamate dioxygenase ferredoxin reductase subunit
LSEKTIIIGAGQAGAQVAMSLRQGGYDGELLLVGKELHLPYQRPPLSKQILKKEWAAERCQLRQLEFYQEHDIEFLLGCSAVSLRVDENLVALDDGTTREYSNLAICTGSRLNRLSIPGADLAGVYYLRTIDEALDLAASLQSGARVAVIGGGYIGLEVAAAAVGLGCKVTVIEALDQIMQRSALPEVAEFLYRRHVEEGVLFRMNSKVSGIIGDSRVEGVELENGSTVPADIVMVGIGVRPDLRWLNDSGLETSRGIQVDLNCRTNIENIYAGGDVAETQHPLLQGWHVLESVQNAVSQGKLIAANILGKAESYSESPWFWSEQYDCRLQMAGIPRAGDQLIVRDNPGTHGMSIFSISGGHLNAVQCLNSPREYMVGRQLITKRVEVNESSLSDSQFNLKDLL